MQLSLYTWNSTSINDGTTFKAWIPQGQLANLSANPVTVNRALAFPFLSTTVLNPHVFVIAVEIAPGANINTNRELLKRYFNIMDATRHNLVAQDAADSNTPYYLTGFPIRIVPEGDSPNVFFITLAVETPVWKRVTAPTFTWNITASGQSSTVTNSGNINVAPILTVSATSAKSGGLSYRRWAGVYNNIDATYTAPFELTSGGIDTAALTTTKMQASGDDFLIMMDGVFVDRWLSGMDTTTTKCWVNLNLSPRREGTTSVTIASSGAITTISFSVTKDNLNFLQAMARAINKVVLIDSEAFTFTGVNLVTYQLTGVTRAAKDSSMAVHTTPKTARWIEHDIWILYGDSTLTAPDVNADNKPMFDLTSTNVLLTYTYFYSPVVNRPMAWRPAVKMTKSGLSHYYTSTLGHFADSSDSYVATELGLAVIAPPSQYNALIETATVEWVLYHPAKMWNVIYSGKKYSTGSWPERVGLQCLRGDQLWEMPWNQEPLPATLYVWGAFGPINIDAGAGFDDYYDTVRFVMDGSLSPVPEETAKVQFDTVSVELAPEYIPTVLLGAETACNWFDITLTNSTTGDYLECSMHSLVTTGVLTIDCENKKAYMQDNARVNVILSTDREGWLNLQPGANTLTYTDAGTVAVTLAGSHRDGNL